MKINMIFNAFINKFNEIHAANSIKRRFQYIFTKCKPDNGGISLINLTQCLNNMILSCQVLSCFPVKYTIVNTTKVRHVPIGQESPKKRKPNGLRFPLYYRQFHQILYIYCSVSSSAHISFAMRNTAHAFGHPQ